MIIEMQKSTPGSADGIRHMLYEKGKRYEMQNEKELSLAKAFIKAGFAVNTEGKMLTPVCENKEAAAEIKRGRGRPRKV
jgi:hypothetical protein